MSNYETEQVNYVVCSFKKILYFMYEVFASLRKISQVRTLTGLTFTLSFQEKSKLPVDRSKNFLLRNLFSRLENL